MGERRSAYLVFGTVLPASTTRENVDDDLDDDRRHPSTSLSQFSALTFR